MAHLTQNNTKGARKRLAALLVVALVVVPLLCQFTFALANPGEGDPAAEEAQSVEQASAADKTSDASPAPAAAETPTANVDPAAQDSPQETPASSDGNTAAEGVPAAADPADENSTDDQAKEETPVYVENFQNAVAAVSDAKPDASLMAAGTLGWDDIYGDEDIAFVVYGDGTCSALAVLHYRYDCEGNAIGALIESMDLGLEYPVNALAYRDGLLYAVVSSDCSEFDAGDVVMITPAGVFFSGANLSHYIDRPTGAAMSGLGYCVVGEKGGRQVMVQLDFSTKTITSFNLPGGMYFQDFEYGDGLFYFLCYDGGALRVVGVTEQGDVAVNGSVSLQETGTSFGSAWMAGNGSIMFADDRTGDVYALQFTAEGLSFTKAFTCDLISGSYNDGASSPGPVVVPRGAKSVGAAGGQGSDSYILANNEEVFEYNLTFRFGNVNHPWSDAAIIDTLPAELQFYTDADHAVAVRDAAGKALDVDENTLFNADRSTFTLDLAGEYGDCSQLAGQTYTVTLYAKIRDNVTDDRINALVGTGLPNTATLSYHPGNGQCPIHNDGPCTAATNTATVYPVQIEEQPAQTAIYRVEHWLQQADGTYTHELKDDTVGSAAVGQTVAIKPNSYASHTYNPGYKDAVSKGTVAADNSLVLKAYYDLNADEPPVVPPAVPPVNPPVNPPVVPPVVPPVTPTGTQTVTPQAPTPQALTPAAIVDAIRTIADAPGSAVLYVAPQVVQRLADAVIGNNETPLASSATEAINDGQTPLGNVDAHCWIHPWIIVGAIASVLYSIAVTIRRRRFTKELDGLEEEAMEQEREPNRGEYARTGATW